MALKRERADRDRRGKLPRTDRDRDDRDRSRSKSPSKQKDNLDPKLCDEYNFQKHMIWGEQTRKGIYGQTEEDITQFMIVQYIDSTYDDTIPNDMKDIKNGHDCDASSTYTLDSGAVCISDTKPVVAAFIGTAEKRYHTEAQINEVWKSVTLKFKPQKDAILLMTSLNSPCDSCSYVVPEICGAFKKCIFLFNRRYRHFVEYLNLESVQFQICKYAYDDHYQNIPKQPLPAAEDTELASGTSETRFNPVSDMYYDKKTGFYCSLTYPQYMYQSQPIHHLTTSSTTPQNPTSCAHPQSGTDADTLPDSQSNWVHVTHIMYDKFTHHFYDSRTGHHLQLNQQSIPPHVAQAVQTDEAYYGYQKSSSLTGYNFDHNNLDYNSGNNMNMIIVLLFVCLLCCVISFVSFIAGGIVGYCIAKQRTEKNMN